jgi:chemotaxis protein MotB
MNIKQIFFVVLAFATLASCTTGKKLKECNKKYVRLDSMYKELMLENAVCKEGRNADKGTIKSLEAQVVDLKANSNQILGQMKDLSIISGAQAESIKKSLDNIGVKDAYIKDLQSAINRKDSMNMALVINLKSAIGNIADQDINVKVDKGVVYVDISDKLLFKSGSYDVTEKAMVVLGKVASVINAQPEIEFMVEGHTDNVSFKSGVLEDNWDLSVKRATSVVRILQTKYHVPANRMTAAGRGEYVPIAPNTTSEGKAANRRTRIVIIPQLDQFFKLLEKPER